jgi:hypothetical protein
MPFIHTSLAQSLFVLLAKSKQCKFLHTKDEDQRLDHATKLNLVPIFPDLTEAEPAPISALRLHSCKALCSFRSDLIAKEIEVDQRCALRQHSCKAFRSSDFIVAEMFHHVSNPSLSST